MTLIAAHRRPSRPRLAILPELSRYYALWRQRQALKSLDARALRDIGLTRGQALTEARRQFWDAPESWPR